METFEVRTAAHAEFREITREVQAVVSKSGTKRGLAIAYIPHTTAGITINENADPSVRSDMLGALERIVPWEQPEFRHAEGNSAAHVKASMMGHSVTIFVEQGKLVLGQWQGIYLDEVWTLDNRAGGISVSDLNDASGAQRLFYHSNTLYNVYGLTDEAGNLLEAYQYDAYGKQTVITDGNDGDTIVNFNSNDVRTVGGNSTVGNPYTFQGQRFDPESGLGYWKIRAYSYDLGRFLERNPWGYGHLEQTLYDLEDDNPNNTLEPLSGGIRFNPPDPFPPIWPPKPRVNTPRPIPPAGQVMTAIAVGVAIGDFMASKGLKTLKESVIAQAAGPATPTCHTEYTQAAWTELHGAAIYPWAWEKAAQEAQETCEKFEHGSCGNRTCPECAPSTKTCQPRANIIDYDGERSWLVFGVYGKVKFTCQCKCVD